MNDPFSNNGQNQPDQSGQNQNQDFSGTQPPQPSGWAPQPSVPAEQPAPASPQSSGSSIPVQTNQPDNGFGAQGVPDITGPSQGYGSSNGPMMVQTASPKSNLWLYLILVVVLIAGALFAASYFKIFNLGSLFGGTPKTEEKITNEPSANEVVNQNDSTRKADLANIKTALKRYFNDNQAYPVSAAFSKTSDTDSPLNALVPDYMAALPIDPLSPNSFYGYKSDGKTFQLSAALEDTSDSSAILSDNGLYLYLVTDSSVETPSASAGTTSETQVTSEEEIDSTVGSESSSSSSSSSASVSADASTEDGASASAEASAF